MSFQKNSQNTKSFNPLHSSYIFVKSNQASGLEKQQEPSKLSQLYTRATSEIGINDTHEYSNIVQNYENKLKSLQLGYERSKEQFENTIKQMYKEKIILLNIISHNQDLVDEFRNKIKLGPQSNFKEVQTKYNIITSGLFNNQLCSNCIVNISRAETQTNRSLERDIIKNPERSSQKPKQKELDIVKQYSWMYLPNEDLQLAFARIKSQNQRLRSNIEQLMQQNIKKMGEKNKEIDHLKIQLSRAVSNSVHKIVHIPPKEVPVDSREKAKQRELARQNELHQQEARLNKEVYQGLVRQLNEKLVSVELERLNAKYKLRYF